MKLNAVKKNSGRTKSGGSRSKLRVALNTKDRNSIEFNMKKCTVVLQRIAMNNMAVNNKKTAIVNKENTNVFDFSSESFSECTSDSNAEFIRKFCAKRQIPMKRRKRLASSVEKEKTKKATVKKQLKVVDSGKLPSQQISAKINKRPLVPVEPGVSTSRGQPTNKKLRSNSSNTNDTFNKAAQRTDTTSLADTSANIARKPPESDTGARPNTRSKRKHNGQTRNVEQSENNENDGLLRDKEQSCAPSLQKASSARGNLGERKEKPRPNAFGIKECFVKVNRLKENPVDQCINVNHIQRDKNGSLMKTNSPLYSSLSSRKKGSAGMEIHQSTPIASNRFISVRSSSGKFFSPESENTDHFHSSDLLGFEPILCQSGTSTHSRAKSARVSKTNDTFPDPFHSLAAVSSSSNDVTQTSNNNTSSFIIKAIVHQAMNGESNKENSPRGEQIHTEAIISPVGSPVISLNNYKPFVRSPLQSITNTNIPSTSTPNQFNKESKRRQSFILPLMQEQSENITGTFTDWDTIESYPGNRHRSRSNRQSMSIGNLITADNTTDDVMENSDLIDAFPSKNRKSTRNKKVVFGKIEKIIANSYGLCRDDSMEKVLSDSIEGNVSLPQVPQEVSRTDRQKEPAMSQRSMRVRQDIDYSIDNCFGFDDDLDDGLSKGRRYNPIRIVSESKVGKLTAMKRIRSVNLKNPLYVFEKSKKKNNEIESPGKKRKMSTFQLSGADGCKPPTVVPPTVVSESSQGGKSDSNNDKIVVLSDIVVKPANREPSPVIFKDLPREPRKSYSGPAAKRKAQSLSNNKNGDDEEDDDVEEEEVPRKKRVYSRKKQLGSKEMKGNTALEAFAAAFNTEHDEIDKFEMVVE